VGLEAAPAIAQVLFDCKQPGVNGCGRCHVSGERVRHFRHAGLHFIERSLDRALLRLKPRQPFGD